MRCRSYLPNIVLDSKLYRAPTRNYLHLEILMQFNNLDLPNDRHTINAWARSFYALEPDIHRIITQHALLLSKYYCLQECEHQFANTFCKEMLEALDIVPFLEQIITEYFVIGEVYIYAQLDEAKGKWNKLMIQNPDYILVKRDTVSETTENSHHYFLRPDENMRRLVLSEREEDIKKSLELNPHVRSLIKEGKNIPLDNFYMCALTHKLSPYEIRGTSFLLPLFPLLKGGTKTPQDTQIIKETLFDTRILNSGVSKDIVMMRYLFIINMLEGWLNKKIIQPIAKIHNFQRQTPDKQSSELCFPYVKFDTIKLRKELNKIK